MTDREAFEAWAKTKGAPFYYEKIDALPEDFNESAWRIWQAAIATAPAWHDKPTTPGDWVIDGKGYRPELQIGITQQEIDRVSDWPGRWYGPIPEDTGGKP